MRRAMIMMALTGTLTSGCVAGLSNAEGWHHIESKHFNMYSSETHLYPQTLLSLEYAYASLSSSFIFQNVDLGKVDVLFLEDGDFTELLGVRRRGVVLPSAPGGGKIGHDGLLVVKADTSGGAGSAGSLEMDSVSSLQANSTQLMAHLYIHKILPGAPLWFHEGFAAYADGAAYKEGGGKRVACFGDPPGSSDSYTPLGEMFSATWAEYDEKYKSWYRHTAETFIDFIIHGEGDKFRPLTVQMMDGIAAGTDSTTIAKTMFPALSLDQLNARVIEHGQGTKHAGAGGKKARGMCPIGFPIPDDKAADRSEGKVSDAAGADIGPLIAGLKTLPSREGYPMWYPVDVLAKIK